MDIQKGSVENLDLRGGKLCLDFVNTVDWREDSIVSDYLHTFQDIVAWGKHVGMLTAEEARHLLDKAEENPTEAEKVFKRIIEVRETLYRIFLSVVQGKNALTAEDMAMFNAQLSRTMAQACIVKTDVGFVWDSNGDTEVLDWMLNPLIRSAADLLVSDELGRVKQCTNHKCDWLFLDRSRNRSRNWCDMKACGNRAKARRFYQRKQQQRSLS